MEKQNRLKGNFNRFCCFVNTPIRLGTEWNDAVPGYMEADLVAHCSVSATGEYVNTPDMTDICTGWTETRAVINKAQKHTSVAIRGIEKSICFTRGRPYTKNDGCHVEQKNWYVVRRNIGYGRYEGQAAVNLLNQHYALLRLHSNFFIPQTRLDGKHRSGARVVKTYEKPVTPHRRLPTHGCLADPKRLAGIRESLNPAELKRGMMDILGELAKLEVRP